MPIEIRELVIKASVVQPLEPLEHNRVIRQEDIAVLKKEIMEECMTKMEYLLDKKSRR